MYKNWLFFMCYSMVLLPMEPLPSSLAQAPISILLKIGESTNIEELETHLKGINAAYNMLTEKTIGPIHPDVLNWLNAMIKVHENTMNTLKTSIKIINAANSKEAVYLNLTLKERQSLDYNCEQACNEILTLRKRLTPLQSKSIVALSKKFEDVALEIQNRT